MFDTIRPDVTDSGVRITLEIDAAGAPCHVCTASTPLRYGLPIDRAGNVVERDHSGTWTIAPCCHDCYDAHRVGGTTGLAIRLRALRSQSATAMRRPVLTAV